MFKNIEVTQDLLDYIYSHASPLHPVQKEILEYNKTIILTSIQCSIFIQVN